MTVNVKSISHIAKVHDIADMLLSCKHMSFPVLDDKGYSGIINRIDLVQLFLHPEIFQMEGEEPIAEVLKFHRIHTDKLHEEEQKIVTEIKQREGNENQFIHLLPYTNRSSIALPDTFSLHRAYLLLRYFDKWLDLKDGLFSL